MSSVKAAKLGKERPKIKEALENLKIDREQQKMVEKKIEETRAKQVKFQIKKKSLLTSIMEILIFQ